MTYYPTAPTGEMNWIQTLLEKDADILVCFNNAALFEGESNWGHVCLIDSVSHDSETLIDSEGRQPKFRKVGFVSLCSAIAQHGGRIEAVFGW